LTTRKGKAADALQQIQDSFLRAGDFPEHHLQAVEFKGEFSRSSFNSALISKGLRQAGQRLAVGQHAVSIQP
jgi:hypothetical protein